MTAFSSLPAVWQTVIMSILFAALTGELLLLIFKLAHTAPLRLCVFSGILMTCNFLMMILMTHDPHAMAGEGFMCSLPWLLSTALVLLSALHLALAFPNEQKRSKACLSPSSIYETTNDLPMGICFADPNGRIILCNHKMRRLANLLIGCYPQIISELTAAVKAPPEKIALLPDGSLRLENGRIYRFKLIGLTVKGQTGWQQLTAQEVTEQHRINEQLALENEKLKKTNIGLQQMFDRMADDIREKESLELKVYIHDTIGRSLLTIQDIIHSDAETENKLRSLKEAVGVLSSNRPSFKGTLDEVKQNVTKMGVNVKITGSIPIGTTAESLIVLAARECVTNCLRHAKGNEITVDVKELGGIYKVTVTNNGEKPKDKITEGSGLSSLRRSVEAVGGEMYVSHYPAFALILHLPGKELRDD